MTGRGGSTAAPGSSVAEEARAGRSDGSARRVDSARDRWVLPAVWLLTAGYLWLFVRTGWIPHDEGTIGQSAERVLLGELPHRDFIDVYTGGLSFLHALAFQLFGLDLLVPRLVLYVFALVWLPCVYWIVRRFLSVIPAALVTLTAVAWSLPHYFVAMPSWYNLFFATGCTAALLRFLEVRNRFFLALAGFAAGLSVVVKVSGLFAVAAGMLAIAYIHADSSGRSCEARVRLVPINRTLLLGLPILLFLALLLLTLSSRADLATLLHFFLPATAVAWMIVRTPRGPIMREFAARWTAGLLIDEALFLLGVAVPLALFAFPFVAQGAVGDLVHGVFVLPTKRLIEAAWPPPPVELALPAVGAVLLLARVAGRTQPLINGVHWLLAFIAASAVSVGHLFLIATAQSLIPVVVIAGVVLILKRQVDAAVPRLVVLQAGIVIIMLALCTLIQFPYAYRIYFLYVAPLLVLALAAGYRLWQKPPRAAFVGALFFALTVGTVGLNHRLPFTFGYHYSRGSGAKVLPLDRGGGIRTSCHDARVYDRVVTLLRDHAHNGITIAAPDAPEVYFLAGLRNPTPHLFEFFGGGDVERELLSAIDSLQIGAVAVNQSPDFTPQLSASFMRQLEQRFTHKESVAHYLVLWRN